MSIRLPVPFCAEGCSGGSGAQVDPGTRRRRLLRLAGTLAGAAVRIHVLACAGERGQRRIAVCSAADVLTALGIRVEVINPAVPWPRTRRGELVVSNHLSWLDDLALLVAVRAIPVARAEIAHRPLVGGLARRMGAVLVDRRRLRSVADGVTQVAHRLRRGQSMSVHPARTTSCGAELGRFRVGLLQAAVDAGAPVCPVAIRYRLDGEVTATPPPYLRHASLVSSVAGIAAARDLVIEVHLLPALDATAGDRRTLAADAARAIAEVLDAGRSTGSGAPPTRGPRREFPDAA